MKILTVLLLHHRTAVVFARGHLLLACDLQLNRVICSIEFLNSTDWVQSGTNELRLQLEVEKQNLTEAHV